MNKCNASLSTYKRRSHVYVRLVVAVIIICVERKVVQGSL